MDFACLLGVIGWCGEPLAFRERTSRLVVSVVIIAPLEGLVECVAKYFGGSSGCYSGISIEKKTLMEKDAQGMRRNEPMGQRKEWRAETQGAELESNQKKREKKLTKKRTEFFFLNIWSCSRQKKTQGP